MLPPGSGYLPSSCHVFAMFTAFTLIVNPAFMHSDSLLACSCQYLAYSNTRCRIEKDENESLAPRFDFLAISVSLIYMIHSPQLSLKSQEEQFTAMESSAETSLASAPPPPPKQYGLTKPLSLSGPSEADLQRNAELEKVIPSSFISMPIRFWLVQFCKIFVVCLMIAVFFLKFGLENELTMC